MEEIKNLNLINKFIENSLDEKELELFNKKYKEEPEFASLTNTYFDMSIAIKAADEFGKKVAKRDTPVKKVNFADYKWVLSLAASLILIFSISIYAVYLYNQNKNLNKSYEQLAQNVSALKNELNAINTNTEKDNISKNQTNSQKETPNDKKYLANVLAMAEVIETMNSNIETLTTRNSGTILQAFPLQSKLINTNEASVVVNKALLKQNISFYLVDFSENDTVLHIEKVSNHEISLNKAQIQGGKKYYWILQKNKQVIESGNFSVLSPSEKNKTKSFSLQNGNDYMEAFIYYYKNGFYFEAKSLLDKATRKYPDVELFNHLQKLLLSGV